MTLDELQDSMEKELAPLIEKVDEIEEKYRLLIRDLRITCGHANVVDGTCKVCGKQFNS